MSVPARLPVSAHVRLLVSLAVGVVVGVGATLLTDATVGPLAGLLALHVVNVVWGWHDLWPLDADATRANASREDVNRLLVEVLGVVICAGGVLAIAALLLAGSSSTLTAVLALLGVVASWWTLHLVYAGHYAFVYYDGREGAGTKGRPGGIDWNDDSHQARYQDFFYFSYNLGMTYQVSDTSVSSPAVRAVALRHCLVSYFFGAAILGATINIVSGIATGG